MDTTSDIEIIPINYFHDRDPRLSEGVLLTYWEQLNKDNLVDMLFFDAKVVSFWDFLNFALDKNKVFYVTFRHNESTPVAHFHLTHFEGQVARVHFSILKRGHGKGESVRIAKGALAKLFKEKRLDNGEPLVSTLIGVTPTHNRLACRFIQKVGFRPLATVKHACYVNALDTHVPGLITILEADRLGS